MYQNKFANALSKAQKLMLDESFNSQVENLAKSYRNGGVPTHMNTMPASAGGTEGVTLLEDVMGTETAKSMIPQAEPVQMLPQQEIPSDSKLPKEILESFRKTPAMSGDGTDNSIIGRIGDALAVKKPINEIGRAHV